MLNIQVFDQSNQIKKVSNQILVIDKITEQDREHKFFFKAYLFIHTSVLMYLWIFMPFSILTLSLQHQLLLLLDTYGCLHFLPIAPNVHGVFLCSERERGHSQSANHLLMCCKVLTIPSAIKCSHTHYYPLHQSSLQFASFFLFTHNDMQ